MQDDPETPVKQYGPPKETSYAKVLGGCLLGIGMFTAIFFTIAWLFKENSKDSPSTPVPVFESRATVVYRVLGTPGTKAHIVFTDAVGRTSEVFEEIPWTITLQIRPGNDLSLSAQALGPVNELTCSIVADDRLIEAVVTSGVDAQASCHGVAP